ncbi:hypothetical protein RUM44_006443 [Polyplax serrata]|uniref:Uncharacterized protein n=1 Tax=Polyplax serrata TaxID=468196 RepID=A0ABR1AI62_POLSC
MNFDSRRGRGNSNRNCCCFFLVPFQRELRESSKESPVENPSVPRPSRYALTKRENYEKDLINCFSSVGRSSRSPPRVAPILRSPAPEGEFDDENSTVFSETRKSLRKLGGMVMVSKVENDFGFDLVNRVRGELRKWRPGRSPRGYQKSPHHRRYHRSGLYHSDLVQVPLKILNRRV